MIRNNWALPTLTHATLNLSNAVCYDQYLLDNISVDPQLILQYPNEQLVYSAISTFHQISSDKLAIGVGLGELVPRIFNIFRNCHFTIVTPTWQLVELWCKTNQVSYNQINYKNFVDLDIDQLYNKSNGILYIANPNGINGTVLTRPQILNLCSHYQLVIVDEAYMDFCDQDHSVFADVEQYENLIVTKTFSKSLGIPGLRIGYCTANIDLIERIQEHRPGYILNSLGPALIGPLLERFAGHISRMKETKLLIESQYDVIPSQINSVLFNGLPNINCQMKEVYPNIYRMALVDMTTFKKIKNEC